MSPKDKSMICRMAGNIAGPLLANAMITVSGGLAVHLSQQEIDDKITIVAGHSLQLALAIIKEVESTEMTTAGHDGRIYCCCVKGPNSNSECPVGKKVGNHNQEDWISE